MSAHRRMQIYMEKHKVGALFEDMMSKLITEMPSEPLPFLINMLQHKVCEGTHQTVMSVPRLRRSLGDLASSLEIEKVHVHKKPSSALVRRSRPSTPSLQPHPPPRKSVTLHFPKDKSDLEKSVVGSKSFHHATVFPVNVSQQHSPLRASALETNVQDLFKSQSELPRDSLHLDNNQRRSHPCGGYSGPILPGQVFNDDPLEEELIVIRTKVKQEIDGNLESSQTLRQEKNLSTLQYGEEDRYSHKMKTYVKNSIQNPKLPQFETGIEMYEHVEDLASEGIYIEHASGFMIGTERIDNIVTKRTFKHVDICSICGKLLRYQDSCEGGSPKSDDQTDIPEIMLSKAIPSLEYASPRSVVDIENISERATSASDNARTSFTLDADHTMTTEDLFESPRSLPLPLTPVEKVTAQWCARSLECIHALASGWQIMNCSDSEAF